jgi:hypothetical protein
MNRLQIEYAAIHGRKEVNGKLWFAPLIIKTSQKLVMKGDKVNWFITVYRL